MNKHAYVTLTNGDYIPPTAVMTASLLETSPKADILIMALPDAPEDKLDRIRSLSPNIAIRRLTPLSLPPQCMIYWGNYRIGINKIQMWLFDSYEKIVFLDSDMLILRNIDELFDLDELHAVSEKGEAYRVPGSLTALNSGTLVVEPSVQTFRELYSSLQYPSLYYCEETHGYTWGLTDQELIIAHYSSEDSAVNWRRNCPVKLREKKPWKLLPYYYNAMTGYHGQYDFWNDREVKVIHFANSVRPWQGGKTSFDVRWMAVFRELIKRNALVP